MVSPASQPPAVLEMSFNSFHPLSPSGGSLTCFFTHPEGYLGHASKAKVGAGAYLFIST